MSRGTWAFVLEKVDEGTARLILRERSDHKPRTRFVVFNYLFMERQHFIMERRMLKGIKERTERAQAVDTAGESWEGERCWSRSPG